MAGALIGALRVSLSADTANFEAGMKRAQRQTQTSASAIQKSANVITNAVRGMVAGLSVGLFIQAGKSALEYASHLGELADTLGVTAKDLQTFSYAAGQVGIEQEQLEQGIQKLTISMGKAQLGAKAQADAFKAIGISVDDLKGKDTGEVFRLIADRLQNVSDRSKRAAIEVALFGKAGAKLDNLLSGSQGRLSELSDAAEKLGIVLSDEQIQRADQTADKIRALQTVLKAQIAGAVADNADSILTLANALATLVGSVGDAIKGWRIMIAEFKAGAKAIGNFQNPLTAANLAAQGASVGSLTVKLPPAKPFKRPGSGAVSSFLSSGGGGGGSSRRSGGGRADHSAEDALRDAYQFDQDLRRAQMDVLRATQDLAKDYIERTTIGIDILNAEKDSFAAELQYKVASKEITQTQADQLKAQFDKTDALQRQALLEEEQAQRAADVNMLDQHDFDRRKDILQSQEAIATTASERRKIELELLDIAYQQKKQALEYTIQTSKDIAAVEDARRDLQNLNSTYANDRQGVMRNTQNPLEAWASTVPQTSAEITQALQGIEANGLDSIAGAISGIVSGTESMGEAFQQVAKQMIAEITAIIIKMLLLKAIQAATGAMGGGGGFAGGDMGALDSIGAAGIPGFASGGSMVIGGFGGTDRNVLSMNGLPIARVSKGEGLHIVPSGGGMGGGPVINFHISGTPTRETMNQIASRTRGALAGANRAGV